MADSQHHALAGRLVGDAPLADGSRLADHAHGGNFLLLDRTRSGIFASAVADWPGRVAVVHEAAPSPDCPPSYRSLLGLLVRPDGIIAWAADIPGHETSGTSAEPGAQAPPDPAPLLGALQRWAGTRSAQGQPVVGSTRS